MNSAKTINIQYFAVFREQRGLAAEQVSTSAGSLRELYAELAKSHGFKLPVDCVQVAVDHEFASWDASIAENSTVVFIAPVAGG